MSSPPSPAVSEWLVHAIALWQVTGDGRAAAFEGYALIALFGILATVAWYE